MLGLVNGSLTDDDIRLFVEYGADYLLDIRAAVLIVGVGIHDYIGSQVETGVYACHKALGKSLVALEGHDMMEAQLPCAGNCIVLTSVVDDKILYGVDTVYMPGQVVIGQLQGLFLVIARYLYYQLHILSVPFFYETGAKRTDLSGIPS